MAKKSTTGQGKKFKKKTRQGNSTNTKYGRPGPSGENKYYKKRRRGQGKNH